ncbi:MULTISPECIES: type II toxin-antitoxin system YafQ family toxin [Helicobacter]|uniref:Type II toxin-antitoxin system YafQ family toxin n=3 Tax=Helicobacter TaxID=209 RepID=A0A6D2C7U0_9HELI|nr:MULTISPECIES: type II toxin-antitoxin system YafQ family toxin [Helicobacter]EMZ40763.1 RelE/StbE family addiction module toxin [Helicobacter bilis WiWa]MDY5950317.1 type II toxin-antitoxin system YafQ family toxin [Helicobacter sp.]TLE02568.1 type II toxin-antitoxin system YafQ family toxin [Helicobacter bilis]TLE03652.1 type II toxin-antitoxin system YafQ family toxin [Helicobacter bilis]
MASYNVNFTKSFIKDYKKLQTKDKDLTDALIDKLATGQPLEPKHKDHALSGNLQGFRECHIKPDLLLIYELCDDILQLNALRVGSHSKLFKK